MSQQLNKGSKVFQPVEVSLNDSPRVINHSPSEVRKKFLQNYEQEAIKSIRNKKIKQLKQLSKQNLKPENDATQTIFTNSQINTSRKHLSQKHTHEPNTQRIFSMIKQRLTSSSQKRYQHDHSLEGCKDKLSNEKDRQKNTTQTLYPFTERVPSSLNKDTEGRESKVAINEAVERIKRKWIGNEICYQERKGNQSGRSLSKINEYLQNYENLNYTSKKERQKIQETLFQRQSKAEKQPYQTKQMSKQQNAGRLINSNTASFGEIRSRSLEESEQAFREAEKRVKFAPDQFLVYHEYQKDLLRYKAKTSREAHKKSSDILENRILNWNKKNKQNYEQVKRNALLKIKKRLEVSILGSWNENTKSNCSKSQLNNGYACESKLRQELKVKICKATEKRRKIRRAGSRKNH